MKKWIILFLLICLPVFAYAQQMTIDLGKLTPEQAKVVLEAQKSLEKTEKSFPKTLPSAEQLDWGVQIGKAIASTAKEIGVEANEFAKTPVGRFTIYILAWKLVGKDLWHIVGSVFFWVLAMVVILKTANKYLAYERIVDEKGVVSYKEKMEYPGNSRSVFAAFLFIAGIAITIICFVVAMV